MPNKKPEKFILSKAARTDIEGVNKIFSALIYVAKDLSWDKGKYKPFTISQFESAVKKDKAKFSGETVDSREYNPTFYKKLLESITPFFKSRFVASMKLSKCLKSAKKAKGEERRTRIKACKRSVGNTKTSTKTKTSANTITSSKTKVNSIVNTVAKCRKKAQEKDTRSGRKRAMKKCKRTCFKLAEGVGRKTKNQKRVTANVITLCKSTQNSKFSKKTKRCQKRAILKSPKSKAKEKLKSCTS